MGKKQVKRKSLNKSGNTKSQQRRKKNEIKISYSSHALQRMYKRIITKEEIENAISKGTYYLECSRKFEVVYNNVRIYVEEKSKNSYTVVTVMHEKEFEAKLNKLSKEEKTSKRKIAKRIKQVESTKDLYKVS